MIEWFLRVWLYEVLLGVMLGFVMGYVAGVLLLISEWYNLIDKNNYFTFSTGLTLLVLGVTRLLDMDEVFCVFASGIAFGDVIREDQRMHELQVQEMLNFVLTLTFFLLFGLKLPYDEWANLSWRGPVVCIVLMLVKRLPFVMASFPLLKPHVGNWKEAAFLGWFGPVGVACLYYAASAREKLQDTDLDFGPLWGIASELVICSILLHGFTGVPFTYILWRVNKGVRKELENAMQERKKRLEQVVYPYDDAKNYIHDWLSIVLDKVDEFAHQRLREPSTSDEGTSEDEAEMTEPHSGDEEESEQGESKEASEGEGEETGVDPRIPSSRSGSGEHQTRVLGRSSERGGEPEEQGILKAKLRKSIKVRKRKKQQRKQKKRRERAERTSLKKSRDIEGTVILENLTQPEEVETEEQGMEYDHAMEMDTLSSTVPRPDTKTETSAPAAEDTKETQ